MESTVPSRVSASDVRCLRQNLGLKTSEFAALCGVNVKTIERWENGESNVTGTSAVLITLLMRKPELARELLIKKQPFDLRIKVLKENQLICVIDVNEIDRIVEVTNLISDVGLLPFEGETRPSYERYDSFIRSLCNLNKGRGVLTNPILELAKTGGNDKYRIIIEEKS